jgi:hypothetical protein
MFLLNHPFHSIFLLFLIVGISIHTTNGMRQQAVAVRGIVLCGARPASGVKVKLWDEDDGPDPDDVLDEGYTDGSGAFQLSGSTRKLIIPQFGKFSPFFVSSQAN